MIQPLMEHRLELAGYGTRALELEGEGPPLLLLHGFADSADTWRLILDRLARSDRRALAVDLPGFGAADPLRDGPVLAQHDAFLRAAVRHLGGDVLIAGNSLGGCLALRAAQDDLALAVAPIAPAGFDHPAWFQIIETFPLVRLALAAPLPEPVVRRAVGEAYRQLAFARPRAVAAEVVAGFTAHHRRRADVSRFLSTGRRLLPELQQPFDLTRIDVPVLLIWGDRDRMVTHHGSHHLIDALDDNLTYELLEGCGHCPQVEEPERVATLLLDLASSATLGR